MFNPQKHLGVKEMKMNNKLKGKTHYTAGN